MARRAGSDNIVSNPQYGRWEALAARPLRRVVVLGSAGSGKSTFARRLAALIEAPAIHMDTLFWNPGWRECETEEFRRRATAAHSGPAWVSEGNYSTKTWDLRIPQADAVLWLRQPRALCLARAFWRSIAYRGRTRPDMADGCPEKMDWQFVRFIWGYERNVFPRHQAELARYNVGACTALLHGDGEMDAFLRSVAHVSQSPS